MKKREAALSLARHAAHKAFSEIAALAGRPRPGRDAYIMYRLRYMAMTLGQLFLESLGSGVITEADIDWLLAQSGRLNRQEQAVAQRLGRLLDQGAIQLGCRLPSQRLQHRQILNEWIEPLGRKRHALAA